MKRFAVLLSLLAAFGLAGRLPGFVYIDEIPPWPDGNVTLELQLGSTPFYSDGTNPNQTAIQALEMWNPYMKRVQFTYVNNSGASKSKTNNKNNVFFSKDVFGTAFGSGVLAVTIGRATASAPVEMEVVVNSNRTWDSYRGYIKYSPIDLRRVLAHEFGHVLGLDHPDENGQWITALMNSTVGDLDTTAPDDQNGVGSRYGRGTANPAVAPTITYQPSPVSVIEGQDAWFSAYANGSEPITYQWTKDDVDIPGATSTNLALTRVALNQAGTYKMKATNEAGTATTNPVTLTVTAALAPTFTQHPPDTLSVEAGGELSLNAWATSNTWISYKWTRDDVDIPNATDAWYRVYGVTNAAAGVYRAVATTAGGTATSNPCTVTVIPAKPPVFSNHPQNTTVIIGAWVSFSAYASSSIPVTYQWTRDNVPIPGATSSYFSIQAAKASDAGTYRLVATNAAGSTTSDAAILTINPLPPPSVPQLPNVTVQAGSTFSFNLWSGDNATYQWYFNGQPIPGATFSGYYDSNAQGSDAGEYFVVATNASGSVTSTVGVVTVLAPNTAPLGGWRQALNVGSTACFLFENPARIERFDLAGEKWLSPVNLSRTPTLMTSLSSGTVAVAFYRTLSRVDLSTGTETDLVTLDSDPLELAAYNGRLYVVSLDKDNFFRRIGHFSLTSPTAPIWTSGSHVLGPGLAIDPTHAKVFSISGSISEIASAPIQSDGSVGLFETSPYRGASSNGANRLWINSDDSILFDNNGSMFSTADMSYLGSLGGTLDSLAVRPDSGPLVLRGRRVTGYSASLQELGRLTLTSDAQHVATLGSTIFAFSQPTGAGKTIAWQKHDASGVVPPAVLPAVSPSTLNYSADDVMLARDGTLLVLSRLHGNVFRWSTTEQRYLDPIPLVGRPNYAVYQDATHRLYLGYADGYVRVIDLDTDQQETVFAMAAGGRVLALGNADDHVAIGEYGGYGTSMGIYDELGRRTATRSVSYDLRTQTWNAQRRRIYQLNYSSMVYMEVTEAGTIGTTREAYYYDGYPIAPICISPSGEIVLLGNGRFYNADTLAQNNALPHGLFDAAWLGTRVYTMRNVLDGVELKRWGGNNYGLDATRHLTGRGIRLFACGDGRLVAVTEHAQHVAFTLLDADLVVRTHFEDAPDLTASSLANLSTRAEVGTGENILIAGFVVTGSQTKRILVRAIGPTLSSFGVSGALADPLLTVVRTDGTTVSMNDDWFSPEGSALKAAFNEVKAFSLAEDSLDAAVVVELAPGLYTAKVEGKQGTRGVALVEAYDLDEVAGERRLINISTRALVGIGDKVLIPGIVVEGSTPKRLLIRAVGPGLQRFGVNGVINNPQLRVMDAQSRVVVSNDDWEQDNPDVTQASSSAAGAFRLEAGSKDAALVATLRPGLYTVVVSGVNDATGVALVEVYEVP